MKIKHSEKVSFAVVLVIFAISLFVFSSNKEQFSDLEFKNDFFVLEKNSGTNYFIFGRETSIMPGEFINYYDQQGLWVKSYEVNQVLIPSRQDVEIITQSGKIIGTTRQDIVLEKNWISLPGVFAIRQGKDTIQLKLSDVIKIKGKLWLSVDTNLENLNSSDLIPSFYQKTIEPNLEVSLQERIKWTAPGTEENKSAYDLFTPPIIYILDGELTTKLPEKQTVEKTLEPFGLTFVGITQAEYPLKLKSWVGDTPYFEHLITGPEGSISVRNRVEVGKPYKIVKIRKPGQPSLEICENNDSEKMLTVQYFAVQQYRNPQTGGLKPVGRSMVLDHRLGGKPFEINTLMDVVSAGNFTLNFKASLPGLPPKDFSFENTQSMVSFDYGGRKFLFSELDLDKKSIKVTKQDPRMEEDSYQIFSY